MGHASAQSHDSLDSWPERGASATASLYPQAAWEVARHLAHDGSHLQ